MAARRDDYAVTDDINAIVTAAAGIDDGSLQDRRADDDSHSAGCRFRAITEYTIKNPLASSATTVI